MERCPVGFVVYRQILHSDGGAPAAMGLAGAPLSLMDEQVKLDSK